MLPKKLSVRIALVFALSILVIEVGVVLFTVFQEQDRRVDQKVELLNLVTNALQGDFTRSIKAARYQSLSETVLEITRAFQANSLVIFDPVGAYSGLRETQSQRRRQDGRPEIPTAKGPRSKGASSENLQQQLWLHFALCGRHP